MTTPRDLFIVTMDVPSSRPVEQGDLSLALAGAELIDLLSAEAAGLDDGRITPGPRRTMPDRLMDEAAGSLVREPPYEPVGDWLWRRGRGLAAAYLSALEAEGRLIRQRHRRWVFFPATRVALVDSAARTRAAHRWAADEPVLATLATAVGTRGHRPPDSPPPADTAVTTVLSAVADALKELADERERRARRLSDAAADNVHRGY